MPKSSHDTAALLTILVAFFLGSALLKRASLEVAAEQRTALAARDWDPVAMLAVLGVGVAYFYAPEQPQWALAGTGVCLGLATLRLVRHHSGQHYPTRRRWLLTSSLIVQAGGFFAGVLLRAVS